MGKRRLSFFVIRQVRVLYTQSTVIMVDTDIVVRTLSTDWLVS